MSDLSFTKQDRERVARFLSKTTLSQGVGSPDSPCSIAAINLALTGRLTDERPPCMSPVIYHFAVEAQDSASHAMRNSREWKALLPWAAGSLDEDAVELERLEIVRGWLWDVVLPAVAVDMIPVPLRSPWASMMQGRNEEAVDKFLEAARAILAETGVTSPVIEVVNWMSCVYSCPGNAEAAAESTRDACSVACCVVASDVCGRWLYATSEAVWDSFKPAALLKKLVEHPYGLPAGWDSEI